MAPSPSVRTRQLALLFLAALAAGALPPAAATVYTDVNGPLCANLTTKTRDFLEFTQAPSADDICGWLTQSETLNTCDKLAAVETSLAKPSHRSATCNQTALPQVFGRPAQLQDRRPLPSGALDDAPFIFTQEGATFYWMFSLVRSIAAWVPCSQEGPWTPPAGWQMLQELYLPENGTNVLFGAVILNSAAGQLVVALRGTTTAFEWDLDWQYNQTIPTVNPFQTPIHDGFGWAFSHIWPEIEAVLDQVVVQDRSANQVFVTGHSLGAAVSTLVAYTAQLYLDGELGDEAPVVDAVLTAPPSVAGSDFTEAFNTKVNARRVAFEYDVVPQTPCTPTMQTCNGTLNGTIGSILTKDNITVLPTNNPGDVSDWAYAQIGGTMPVLAADMPQDAVSWAALDNLQICWAEQFLLATHICSYSCFTSQFVPGGAVAGDSCWLSPKQTGTPGSQCQSWPPVPGYPGMAEMTTEGHSIA